MATTEAGVYHPVGTDAFAPHVDMETQADSLTGRVITPVANVAERNALASALAAAGHDFALEPVWVYRTDGGALEVSSGSGWSIYGAATSAGSDSGFPNTLANQSSTLFTVQNRATLAAVPYPREVTALATVTLTSSQAVDIDVALYAGESSVDYQRMTMAVGATVPFTLCGSLRVAAGATTVFEVRHKRNSGSGTVTPSGGSLSRMRLLAIPAAS